MGCIADALKKAQRDRIAVGADRLGGFAPRLTARWSPWCNPADGAPETDPAAPRDLGGDPAPGLSEFIRTYYQPDSPVGEQFRSLRTKLLNSPSRPEHRIFVITSSRPREGKSISAINMAFCVAEMPHLKVLVVDGDLRGGALAGLLNQPPQPGLAELLRNETPYEDVLRPTPLPNLFFLPAGGAPGAMAPKLLSSRTARAAFRRFQTEFDCTMVDTPAMATSADAGIIGVASGPAAGVLFVVRMHATAEADARHAVDRLRGQNVPVLGSIVIGNERGSW